MSEARVGTTLNIQRLLGRFSAGDQEVREELFSRARGRLIALTRLMRRDFPGLRNVEETDDVLQRSLIRLCRALEELRPTSAADFFGLAALQIRRELRDMARHYLGSHPRQIQALAPPASSQNVHQAPSSESDSAISQPGLAEWTEFHATVERLPGPERQAFELIWYHELSQIEAAELMGVSDRQFRRYWVAARLRLQGLLPSFFETD